MTDVATLVPYTRFLELRARRIRRAAELAQSVGPRESGATAASPPLADEERGRVVPILATESPGQL